MSVRVRYAPSPTGLQHIGGVRTALFDYLLSRSEGGAFILRIEDTDRERSTPESLQDIFDTFDWLGFRWDEGPDIGGPKGPYVQSQRIALYRRYGEELLERGGAYRCYCTPERLSRLRTEQAARKQRLGYDRRCRTLSDADRREAENAGIQPVIRLKVPLEGRTSFHDELLGTIEQANVDINPDPVLLKSDGYPTYHLAHVVDDHLMEITHILRAQEWLPSVPVHMLVYQALGWDPPKLYHLPLILGKDGHKLSKRHGSTSMAEFRSQGYLPQAIVNYLALLGWSLDDSRELFSLRELEQLFSLERVNKAPAVFDYQKLDWFNGHYIRLTPIGELERLITPVLRQAGLVGDPVTAEEQRMIVGLVPLIRERIKLLSEAANVASFFFREPDQYPLEELVPKKMSPERVAEILRRIDGLLEGLDSRSEEENERSFRDLAAELGVKLGDMLMPLRVAVTGSRVSPPLFESIRVLGVAKARQRVATAMRLLAGARKASSDTAR